ncbi:MAG TPA: hypothetical protein VGW12_10780 [Pyrinomonadaceae bacterium]|nr:hypothetical protein [Pyrinomonadaceae bacterium]
MTTQDHHRLIAILHLVHGFLAAASAAGLFLAVAILAGFKTVVERWVFPIGKTGGGADPELWLSIITLGLVTLYVIGALIFTVPAIAGGYGMWKQRRWAKRVVTLSAAMAIFNFPFGTAIGVYTIWFLMRLDTKIKA